MASFLSENAQPQQPFVFAAPGSNSGGKGSKPPDHGEFQRNREETTTKKVSFKDMVTGDKDLISAPRKKKDLIMDNGNGYYMVKFDHGADREKVMDGGPWMMFDHYLTIQEWSEEFASPTAKVENIMVWIRFSGLILFYYDESVLMVMASA